MGTIMMYAAINTKIKALSAKLLSKEQYVSMIDTKNYEDAVKYLIDETKYGEVLSYSNSDLNQKENYEIMLKRYYINGFYKLRHYFNDNYKKLFSVLFMRFEIEDIKVILRGKYSMMDKDEIRRLLAFEGPLSKINYDDLLSAKDAVELIDKLHDTKYYKHIAPLASTIEKEGIFRIEMALDFEYFSSLRKFEKLISKEDSQIIEKINGAYCDLLNLQWILRGKKYYNLQPEELLNYTIYDWYEIDRKMIKKLCYAKDIDEFYDLVEATSYKGVFDKTKQEDYLVEKEILSYLKKMYIKYAQRNALNISVVISYLELSLMEIRDLSTILENKRYNLGNEEAIKYLITTL